MLNGFLLVLNNDRARHIRNARIRRGDTLPLTIIAVDPQHATAVSVGFRFWAKKKEDYPNGTPVIIREQQHFTISVNEFNATATTTITSPESGLLEPGEYVYEVERDLDGNIQTLEHGRFHIEADVATNPF